MRKWLARAALYGTLAVACDAARPAPLDEPRQLTLLHTSDIHSRLWPFRTRISSFEADHGLGEPASLAEVGGIARLATLLERERARGPAVWLDSGDALEGAPIFQQQGGRVELELLSGLGLSAMALGNHELSLSAAELADLLQSAATFPVLAANLVPKPASPLQGRLLPSALLRVAGLRLGVIGIANSQSPPGVAEPDNAWRFEAETSSLSAVQAAIDELAPRASLIIALSHLGLDADRELVRGTTGLALVLGGHQHILTAEPDWQEDCSTLALAEARGCSPERVPIVHSGAYGQWLNRLELKLDRSGSGPAALEISRVVLESVPVAASVPEHPAIAAYLADRAPELQSPLAFLPDALRRRSPLGGDSALGDLTSDAVLTSSGADVALLNSSGLRDDLEAGVLLPTDLELAFPFAEPWQLVRVSGRTLREGLDRAARHSAERECESTLQVAGLRLTVRCGACERGASACLEVERETPLGRLPLLDDEWLLVALPAYLTLPGADFEAVRRDGAALELSVREALEHRIAQRQPIEDTRPCQAALKQWSERRCAEAFGEISCPLSAEAGDAICASLPLVEKTRDGRIQMSP